MTASMKMTLTGTALQLVGKKQSGEKGCLDTLPTTSSTSTTTADAADLQAIDQKSYLRSRLLKQLYDKGDEQNDDSDDAEDEKPFTLVGQVLLILALRLIMLCTPPSWPLPLRLLRFAVKDDLCRFNPGKCV